MSEDRYSMAYPKLVQSESFDEPGLLSQDSFHEMLGSLEQNIGAVAVVSNDRLRFLLLALISQGHVLLEDSPGVGKTLTAKSLAQSIDSKFARIQCTPDLLPSDITGTSIYNMNDSEFEFRPGPVFSNILLADEVNRTGPRTQSALLEAMAEGQVSADGKMYGLPDPFMVIATQNSMESHGVFPLPDSQLDRFLIKMSLGLPTAEQELEILSRTEHGMKQAECVLTIEDVKDMQDYVNAVEVAVPVKEYMVQLSRATREHPYISSGVSPRGTVLLQRASQAWAAMEGRIYAVPEDVKHVAPMVLPHRMAVRAAGQVDAEELIREILDTVNVPL